MDVATRAKLEARIREIDELLLNREACKMTEGWLTYAPDTSEVAELFEERERLLQELSKAA